MNAFGQRIDPSVICVFDEEISKFDALARMVDSLMHTNKVTDRDALHAALFERESIRSTGFRSVAIPHVRIDEVTAPIVAVGVSKRGIDFEALDSEPVHIVVLFAMPSGSDKEYLGLLAQVMMALRTTGFCEDLVECKTPEEVSAVLEKQDA